MVQEKTTLFFVVVCIYLCITQLAYNIITHFFVSWSVCTDIVVCTGLTHSVLSLILVYVTTSVFTFFVCKIVLC